MKFFIDSANFEDIRKAYDLGFVTGVTTNPAIILREDTKDLEKRIKSIREMVEGEILAQVVGKSVDEMVRQAKLMNSWDDNITVKLPATMDGIKAVSIAAKEGVRTCAAAIYNVAQAIAAAAAGAYYVAPFVNRSNALGLDGVALAQTVAKIFRQNGIDAKIIGASIDSAQNITDMALAGITYITAPLRVLENIVSIVPADDTVVEFLTGWSGDEF